MTSEEKAQAFQLVDEYSRTKYQCFLAEMFANKEGTGYTLCFRPVGGSRDSSDRYACRYLDLDERQLVAASRANLLPSSVTEKLDSDLSNLAHSA